MYPTFHQSVSVSRKSNLPGDIYLCDLNGIVCFYVIMRFLSVAYPLLVWLSCCIQIVQFLAFLAIGIRYLSKSKQDSENHINLACSGILFFFFHEDIKFV